MADLIAANSSHANGRVLVKTKCATFGIVEVSEYALSLKILSKLTSRESAVVVKMCRMRIEIPSRYVEKAIVESRISKNEQKFG